LEAAQPGGALGVGVALAGARREVGGAAVVAAGQLDEAARLGAVLIPEVAAAGE